MVGIQTMPFIFALISILNWLALMVRALLLITFLSRAYSMVTGSYNPSVTYRIMSCTTLSVLYELRIRFYFASLCVVMWEPVLNCLPLLSVLYMEDFWHFFLISYRCCPCEQRAKGMHLIVVNTYRNFVQVVEVMDYQYFNYCQYKY